MKDLLRVIILALALGSIAMFAALYWQGQPTSRNSQPLLVDTIQFSGTMGGNFTLVDQQDAAVNQNDLQGQYSLIYFGYSYCPDVCPVSLLTMINAYAMLPEPIQQQVQPIFITVDPKRDTPAQMASYVEDYHPDLQGWSGSEAEINHIKSLYRVYAEITGSAAEISNNTYLVNHSSMFYLLNPQGEVQILFNDDIASETLSQNIITIVQ